MNLTAIVEEIRGRVAEGKKIAFISGNFNVVHPGHVRMLNFAAECADFLIVGITPDGHPDAIVPGELRLESVKAIGLVDFACVMAVPVQEFIAGLKPDIVVKGKEHELQPNVEQEVVESYGGQLIFASGEIWFSCLK